MAGWSISANGSAADCGNTMSNFQSNGCCPEIGHDVKDSVDDSDGYKDELKCMFDQVLSTVLKEVKNRGCIRPIPAMLGVGQSLDLFKLFCVVRERGGFHMVSKNGLWDFVLQELGLDLGASASVKLMYSKYLDELEKWLMGSGWCGSGGNFGFLPLELETEFRGLLMKWPYKEIKDDKLATLEFKKNAKHGDLNIEKNELDFWDTKNRHEKWNAFSKRCCDSDDRIHGHDDKLCDNNPSVNENEFCHRKRKRESLSGILNWVIQIAKYPDDPSIGAIPEPSKWKEHGDKELWEQAIRARDALLRRRHVENIQPSFLQNSQKMHLSMYEDVTDQSHQPRERLRCSERLLTIVKPRLCPCCSSRSATENKSTSPRKTELETGPVVETPMNVALSALNATVCFFGDEPQEKHVSVGPLFQAGVPKWTGVVLESDSKWLGTRIWSLVDGERNSIMKMDSIGRGRRDSCSCRLPGSVECVKVPHC